MIVMYIRLDNFMAFKNFHMNTSYPKKIVDSYIEEEFLEGYPNFRYKKVNILMGANATGKTSIGKMLMKIFNFLDKRQFERVTDVICDTSKEASFTLDLVVGKNLLYRIEANISPKSEEEYQVSDIDLIVKQIEIGKKDSYESCLKRMENLKFEKCNTYIEELEKVKGLSWIFEYPKDAVNKRKMYDLQDTQKYMSILEHTLKALDPAIKEVKKIEDVEDAYVIRMENGSVIIQDGKMVDSDKLSSGTKAGIDIAAFLDSIMNGNYGFYYCDEKFSYIHSDIEKAFLAVMIQGLDRNDQLFFTTHNMDILDMPLPKHSFYFLRKDPYDKEEPIKCINASQYLKRNTDSVRNAVDNDLFTVAPNVELIYELAEM